MRFQDRREEAARLLCLTAELVGEKHRRIAELHARLCRRGAKLAHAAVDLRTHVVEHFRRFDVQKRARRVGHFEIVLLCDALRVLRRGGVRTGGTGRDHVQRIAENVRKDDRLYPCRPADLGEPAAFDLRKPLADRVDLGDVGAAGKQLSGDVLQLGSGHQRLFKQRAAAAGKQEQNGVLFGKVRNEVQRRLRAFERVFVGNGMSRFEAVEIGDRAHYVTVFGDDDALFDPAFQHVGRGFCHLPRRLAGGDQQNAPRKLHRFQRTLHGGVRLDGGDRVLYDPVCMRTKVLIHGFLL